MKTHQPSLHSCDHCSGGNQIQCNLFWSELQNWLKPYVLSWIYMERLPIWRGQEHEIADDILQETCIRILRYLRPVIGGATPTIASVEHFSLTVARNCVRDQRRRQSRLVHLTTFSFQNEESIEGINFSEFALEQLMLEDLFTELAHIINEFPPMQRQAILVDLAKYADFAEEASPLLDALLKMGINLHDYRRPRPLDIAERNKQASLLSTAYKRLRRTFSDKTKKRVA